MLKKLLLPRVQRNQLLEEIKRQELDPGEFEWGEAQVEAISSFKDAAIVSELVHRPSGYSFRFDLRAEVFFVTFSPARDRPERHEGCSSLAMVMGFVVNDWLPSLKQEIETTDLWEQIARPTRLMAAMADQQDNAPFSPEEQSEIRATLAAIRSTTDKEFTLSKEHREILGRCLAHLERAASRVGRKDWFLLVLGSLTSYVLTAGLESSDARRLFELVLNAITEACSFVTKMLPA